MNKIKVKIALPDPKILLKYGDIISENEYGIKEKTKVIRVNYMGFEYMVKLLNGEIISLKQWDNFSYTEGSNDVAVMSDDVAVMSDDELANMLMFSDRDRKSNKRAENVYWLCVKEINRRND